MKLLVSLTYYTPYLSGLTLYAKRLAEALVSQGDQVTVLTMQDKKNLPEEETMNGVKVVRAKPVFKISKGFFSLDWLSKSAKLVWQNEAVIINLPQFEGFIPAFLAKLLGKKVISVYHCEVILPAGFFNRVVNFFLNLANFLSLALSHVIITYTRDFAEHSRILSNFAKKTEYVYPPIKRPSINKRTQDLLREKIGRADFKIGIAARLSAEKGIEYLLEAIPLLKIKLVKEKIKIIFAGSLNPVGEEQYKEKILELVQKYQKEVVFLGELKEEEMGAFYSLIDILVLPSVNSTEAFGMVQVEAMMMGVPVVASNLPGVRVPLQKTEMGEIVPIRNKTMLAEAILAVLHNRSRYIKSKALVQEEFAIDKTIKKYKKLLAN